MKLLFTIILGVFFHSVSIGQEWKRFIDSGGHYFKVRQTKQALVYYEKAKELIPKDSFYTDTHIQLTRSIARIYYDVDKPRAIKMYEELRTRIEKLHTKRTLDYAAICNNLGNLYIETGKLDTARSIILMAKLIRDELLPVGHADRGQSSNNLGSVFHSLGQFREAESLLLEAKQIREQLPPVGMNSFYANTCVGLANLYRDMGQIDKAEKFYLLARDIRALNDTARQSESYASSCNILADFYNNSTNEYSKAEAMYLEAKQIRANNDSNSYEFGQTCNNLAYLYKNMGQFQKAETLLLRAKALFEEHLEDDNPSRTIQMNNLGELYNAMGNYKLAEEYFIKARKRWKEALGEEHPYFIANTDMLANTYWNLGKTEKAEKLYADVAKLKYKQLGKIFEFTNESEKQLYLANINGAGDEYYSFYLKGWPQSKAGQPYDMSLANRNLILSSAQKTRDLVFSKQDSSLIQLYNEWKGLKERLANIYASGAAANQSSQQNVLDRAEKLEKELAKRSAAFKSMQKKMDWKDVREKLQADEAAIEFIRFNVYDGKERTDSFLYAAVVVRKQSEPMMIPLFEERQLQGLLLASSKSDAESINRLYGSTDVYNLAWKPIEKQLAGVKHVYFAPVGQLFRVSLPAIRIDGRQVLGDKYRLSQLNSTANISGQKDDRIAAGDRISLFGGILYDADSVSMKRSVAAFANRRVEDAALTGDEATRGRNIDYLPGTKEEIDIVGRMAAGAGLDATSLTGLEASEESIGALTGKASPAILHIATHGFFFPDPKSVDSIRLHFESSAKAFRKSPDPLMRAGLLFAGAANAWRGKNVSGIQDGIVTAYELGTRLYLPNTKLVVLSACETGLGELQGNEGVYGLQRAFQMAGAQNLVMSLWKVPDAETSEFMQAFYKSLFKRQTVGNAFYQAQQHMKSKYRDEPYKWAAWVLTR